MINIQQLWQELTPLYNSGEAKAIIRTVLEVRFGLTLADILCDKVSEFSAEERQTLEEIIQRLKKGEPVQYILGRTDFCGHTFKVAPGVLIPRPETAELCELIIRQKPQGKILDIGTGSGCIAITLALALKENVQVTAWDLSEKALQIAEDNARKLHANVNFICQDALQPPPDHNLWNCIVSNPPYIAEKERTDMEKNVLDYEPDMALFVPNDDPLRFYRSITRYAKNALRPEGALYFEINPLYEDTMKSLIYKEGFRHPVIHEDLFGKPRMLEAHL